MQDDDYKAVKDFMQGDRDFGLEPIEAPLQLSEQKIAALTMGLNAAIVQFINEGLFPVDQQMHFMGHLQDFAARLFAGEKLRLPNVSQTLSVQSQAGKLFVLASDEALENGSKNFQKIKEMAEAEKQTNNLDGETHDGEIKPKWLN